MRAVVGEDGGLSPKLAALVDGWLDEIADTLLALDPDAAIDPRFIDGLLVAAPIRA